MTEVTLKIQNRTGMHVRVCGVFAREASRYRCKITLSYDGKEVDGKSILGVIMLAAEYGAEILLRAEGEDEVTAAEDLVNLVGNRFGIDEE